MFVEIPPHVSVRDFVRRAEGRSSRKIQHIRKRYWGQRFWGRGYFSTRSGNIIDDIVNRYLDRHTHKNGFSPPRLDPTGVSRSVSNIQPWLLSLSLPTLRGPAFRSPLYRREGRYQIGRAAGRERVCK